MNTLNEARTYKKGILLAREITRKHAKTFYLASHFLSQEKKNAAYSVYAVCRISDEAVDSNNSPSKRADLDEIKYKIESAYKKTEFSDCLLAAFSNTVLKYTIPKQYFDELIKGMYMDLEKDRYDNFNELYTYCYRVAGVIGLIMLHIFGYQNEETKEYAVDLGIALQLTNILRDIKEDYERGRIYLPTDEMSSFGINEQSILHGIVDKDFISFMKFQIKRAREYYEKSSLGIKMIRDRKSRAVVLAIKEMYQGILRSIERNNFDVFTKRARVNNLKKISIGLRTLLKSKTI